MTHEEVNKRIAQRLGYTVKWTLNQNYALYLPNGSVAGTWRNHNEQSAWKEVPRYSTDLNTAWTLFAWLKQQPNSSGYQWSYEVLDIGETEVSCILCTNPDDPFYASHENPAMAICLAFLKIFEEETHDQ